MESAQLTEPLWQEIGKYRAILDTASNADSVVKQKFAANEKGIELLSKTEVRPCSFWELLVRNETLRHCESFSISSPS